MAQMLLTIGVPAELGAKILEEAARRLKEQEAAWDAKYEATWKRHLEAARLQAQLLGRGVARPANVKKEIGRRPTQNAILVEMLLSSVLKDSQDHKDSEKCLG